MFQALFLILGVALLFFAALPGTGAFVVRSRWRRFRSRIIEASRRPLLTYASLHRQPDAEPRVRTGGPVRFLGTLESIQGEKTIWVRGPDLTLAVDMDPSEVYILPGGSAPAEEPPFSSSWSRIGSLPEGVRIMVSGTLDTHASHPLIRASGDEPTFVIIYDGPDSSLVRRCSWSGRHLNEYWNPVTPGALAGGTLAMVITAYVLLRQPALRQFAQLSLALAAMPILPLLPPGVVLYYLYRWSWRRARMLRAHRDILRLPLRYFEADEHQTVLPDGETYAQVGVEAADAEALRATGAVVLRPPVSGHPLTAFGRPVAGCPPVAANSDPLAEVTVVAGDPRLLAAECQRLARRHELLSAVVFGAGMAVNLLLVVYLLGLLL